MGSLIKSPGGTIVSSGGYIAGRADLVAAAAARLTAPGVGVDAGSVPGETLRLMAQGMALLKRAMCNYQSVGCRSVGVLAQVRGLTLQGAPDTALQKLCASAHDCPLCRCADHVWVEGIRV